MSHSNPGRRRDYLATSVLAGAEEPIFQKLPERVLANLSQGGSENAFVWNTFYPLAQPTLSLTALLAIQPLWGSPGQKAEDACRPFFWGYDISGTELESLKEVLDLVDGSGLQTEVDLILLGRRNLVMVEAKLSSVPGRCARYAQARCPEIHLEDLRDPVPCRYWEEPPALFTKQLNWGPRPSPGDEPPPCYRHYQLGRTLIVGVHLAARLSRTLHLWLVAPRRAWRSLERGWLDFSESVIDHALWRRLRVLAFEDLPSVSQR